ncbi:MAG: PorP/SprF family type IX secretion system membrane protein, partial [Chitinophagales bacterium]
MRKLLFYFIILFSFVEIIAQDIHYSQFYNSPLTLNPATTGLINGSFRASAIYRSQWWNTTNKFSSPGYQTPSASIDFPIRINNSALGIGVTFVNDKVAEGLMNDFYILGSLSYIQSMGKDYRHQLSFGLQAAYMNRQIDASHLQYASQFQANQFSSAFGLPEDLQSNTFNQIDVNAGLLWYGNFSKKFRMYLGGSLYNIVGQDIAYTESNSLEQSMRYSAHTGLEIGLGKRLELLPSILYFKQQQADQINSGMALAFKAGNLEKPTRLLIGGYLRSVGWVKNLSMDAAIAYIGLEFVGFRLGMSYDYTLSDLKNAQ